MSARFWALCVVAIAWGCGAASTSTSDARTSDARPGAADVESFGPDAAPNDARPRDTRADFALADGTPSDTPLSDAGPSDAALSDAALSDAALSDVALSDAALSDAALSDGTPPDTAPPDAGLPPDGPCAVGYAPPSNEGEVQDPEIVEASGVVASRVWPDVLWVHNDSGAGPRLHAIGTDGAAIARLDLPDVDVDDAEDIAAGPCPGSDTPCLWLADSGDNDRRRDDVAIYVTPEPEWIGEGGLVMLDAEVVWRFPFSFPDGEAIDIEAFLVAPDGEAIYMIEKIDGDAARLFGYEGPFIPEEPVELELLATIPAPGVAIRLGRMITGADLHPDGNRAVIRVYTGSFEYRWGADADIASMADIEPVTVALGPLTEGQGEAVGYDSTGRGIWTLSEGDAPMLHHYRCRDDPP